MPKPKCKSCRKPFERVYSTTQQTCSMACAIKQVDKDKAKVVKESKKVARKALRERKQALKSKSDWTKEAQTAANAYTRKIDSGNACISCGLFEHELKINSPIAMVCGHYLSVGAYPELRFHDFNRNLQCTRCNGGAGKYGNFNNKEKTVTQNYRINLIKKIGLKNVEWLEGHHEIQHLSIEDIVEIKQYYKEQLKLIS